MQVGVQYVFGCHHVILGLKRRLRSHHPLGLVNRLPWRFHLNDGHCMITVHHLNNSRSQRILWLLEELGLKYEIKRYERDAKTMLAPPALRKVHPLGKSPVITDGNLTLAAAAAQAGV